MSKGAATHLNYCRQMVRAFEDLSRIPSVPAENKVNMALAIDLAKASQKFLLPPGGLLIDDKEFRGLDEGTPLRLPYPFVALEYETSREDMAKALTQEPDYKNRVSAWVLLARERADGVALNVAVRYISDGAWVFTSEIFLPETGYLKRQETRNGFPGMVVHLDDADEAGYHTAPIRRLLSFINALSCSNVRAERSEPTKQPKKALPFDSYYVLTIDGPTGGGLAGGGTHRSPREHLRRGHIRRYESGLKVWVNAHVVAAGRGAGTITKDYRVAA